MFHPGSQIGVRLATHLFELLHGLATDWGPRIPVRFGATDEAGAPIEPVLRADRALVVVLVDTRMARTATVEDATIAAAWAELIESLLQDNPPGVDGRCSMLPVAMDGGAFTLSERLDHRSFVRLDTNRGDHHLDFHAIIGCLRLLQGRAATVPRADSGDIDQVPAPEVEIFVSHAKRDLSGRAASGPVASLLTAHHPLPVTPWFDASNIPVGAAFAAEIDRAVRRASAVVVVLTDHYSSREWCRIEILAAKSAERPIVVVDAITSRVARMFPYLGNTPTIRWRAAILESARDAATGVSATTTWEEEDAEQVLLSALLEALRYRHDVARLNVTAAEQDQVLGSPPEAITLAAASVNSACLLYPDPPLGREEVEQILKVQPGLTMETPLQRLARQEPPRHLGPVALSLSDATDAIRYGGSGSHLDVMVHDLTLYLLLSGLRLVYGGVLGYSSGEGRRDVDYVDQLMNLVKSYSPLAPRVGRQLGPVENWLPWPTCEELRDDQLDGYTQVGVRLIRLKRPADLELVPGQFDRSPDGRYPTDTTLARYVRARGLTAMRSDSTSACSARIAVGGQLTCFSGTLPGVVEECLITLRAGKPLYLLGGFGGATRLVADLLRGEPRGELTTRNMTAAARSGWTALCKEYDDRGVALTRPEAAAQELRALGERGMSAVLANGLSDAENEELNWTTDARRAVELVLHGLHQGAGSSE